MIRNPANLIVMKFINFTKLAATSLVLGSLTSCMDIDQEITVNTDNSGAVSMKVTMEESIAAMMDADPENALFAEEKVAAAAKDVENIKSHKTIKETKDGKAIRGLALEIKDLTKDLSEIGKVMSPGETSDEDSKGDAPKFTKLANGNLSFEYEMNAPPMGAEGEEPDPQQMAMMEQMFAGKKFTTKLNGPIVSSNGKIADDKKSVTWEIPWTDMLKGKIEPKIFKAEIGTAK